METTTSTNGKAAGRHYTSRDWNDVQHTGPNTLAGRYLRMFWQPVAVADEVQAGDAVPIRVMSEDFTLYRGEGGTPHIVDFRCAHQATQLSTGWVEADNIRCFFHGWVYDPTGQCIEQPGEWQPFCQKIKIRSVPTQEYLGMIFGYFGEGEPLPIPRYPDFEREGILDVTFYERECNYSQDFEPKPIHGNFVHSDGPPFDRSMPVEISAEETDWGFTTFARHANGQVKAKPYGMPNVHHVKGPPDRWGSGWSDNLVHIVPIDDQNMRSYTVRMIHLTGDAAQDFLARRAADGHSTGGRQYDHEVVKLILAGKLRLRDIDPDSVDMTWLEDDIAYVGQGRIADRSKEHLAPSDCGNVLMRQLWARELQALAEGRPLKQWRRQVGVEGLVATDGVR